MNVYDFDKTIYDGDSTVDFYFYCLRRYPSVWAKVPRVLWHGLRLRLGRITKTQFKSVFFEFITALPCLSAAVQAFWNQHLHKIKAFYYRQQRQDDVIISASPAFLLSPAMELLHIQYLIATEVDVRTGRLTGENCYGAEKARRFRAWGGTEIERFYSDSRSDAPLAALARQSYLVRGAQLIPWH